MSDGTYLVGGMVYDQTGHSPSQSVRTINPFSISKRKSWRKSHKTLSKKRAFACAVNIKERNIAVLGGLREEGGALEVLRYSDIE